MKVEKDTFVRVMTRRVANIDVTEGIRRWFKAFDLDSSGFISLANFKQVSSFFLHGHDTWHVQVCQAIAPHMPPSVVHQLFREADTNHDDKVKT
ncbi:hypothetical protein DYB37_003173 [Aphanomyces astaci]|uniref:EF-hand domain-containing protein n=1 Tax=Aphanomyces astaci TaxID=112090 RepID=A0A3R7BW96_APHAT|nr:hypothetical protein DYB35_002846 [Aphanomyces astaci]RHZ25341.1 hypothetical protein DYB37_003173 [Aphanomyces astaci]